MSVNVFARNPGARNDCANFMGACKNALFLQEKTHVHKLPRLSGGGILVLGGGGGSADFFYFYGREDFSD